MINEKDFKPDILDSKIIQIWNEPGIVVINSPTALIRIPRQDWLVVKKELKKLK